jgi:hypothetical protein
MEKQLNVFLVGGDDDEQAVFILIDDGEDCQIRCAYRDKKIETRAADFFEALCNVRTRLAEDGLIPFCYGASLNVYPSAMARDMGRGLRAYRLSSGKQAKIADLVDIFAAGPDIMPASVETQKQFYRDWLAAPRL